MSSLPALGQTELSQSGTNRLTRSLSSSFATRAVVSLAFFLVAVSATADVGNSVEARLTAAGNAQATSIDQLLAHCPTTQEVNAINADLQLNFEADPTREQPLACTAAGGSADLTRLQKRVYQSLLAMQQIPFDAPFPWTALPLYQWLRTSIGGIHFMDSPFSFCCEAGGVIVIKTAATQAADNSCLMAGNANRWVEPDAVCGMDAFIGLVVHEARHNQGFGHTCGPDDNTIDELGAWAVQHYMLRWFAEHSGTFLTPGDGLPSNTFYRESAAQQAHDICSSRFCSQGCPDEGTILGTITDAITSDPIVGVTVQVFDTTGNLVSFRGLSGVDGKYLSRHPTGTYFARTSNNLGYVDKLFDNIDCVAGCSPATGTPIEVTAGSTVSAVDFKLTPGGRVSGRVTDAVTGAGISGVGVQFYDQSGTLIPSAAVSTDDNGNYTSQAGLPTGSYFSRTFNNLGFNDELFDNISCSSSCPIISGTPIAVTAGSTTTGINFALTNGTAPSLSINDVTVKEGNSGTTPAIFTVTLSSPAAFPVRVRFFTEDGTATTAGSDYTATSGILVFDPGTTSQTVTVNVTGDTHNEPSETFFVNLSAPINASIVKGQGVGTIATDDLNLFAITKALQARAADMILSGRITIDSFNSINGPWGGRCPRCKGGVNIAQHGDIQAAGAVIRSSGVIIKGAITSNTPSTQPPLPLPAGAKNLGHYLLAGNQKVSLPAGNYVADTFTMTDFAQLTAQGTVRIWVRQAINLAGSATTQVQSVRSNDLWLIGMPAMQQANINGTVRFNGVIYAPDAVINVAGACNVFGGLAGSGITLNGDHNLHFDEDLAGSSTAATVSSANDVQ